MILAHQKIDFGQIPLIEKVKARAPFRFQFDFPDEACLIYVLSGHTTIHSPTESAAVKQQDSVLLKCGTYFSALPDTKEDFEVVVFHLPKEVLKNIYTYGFQEHQRVKQNRFISSFKAHEGISAYIRGLDFYFKHPDVANETLLSAKIKELISLLLQTANAEDVEELLLRLFSPVEVNFREVVEQHIFSEVAVEDLAFLCHMSVSTFKRKFKEIFEDSPANYLRRKRLERAAELLKVSEATVSDIAWQTGFNDVAHFSRSFKSVYQLSPKAYRAQFAK